jgi:hypothetical protein
MIDILLHLADGWREWAIGRAEQSVGDGVASRGRAFTMPV